MSKTRTRIGSLLLAVLMLLSLLPVSALATETDVSNPDQTETTTDPSSGESITTEEQLKTAIGNAQPGDTITLDGDIAITAPITITKQITLNLNKKKIAPAANATIWDDSKKDWSLIRVAEEGDLTITGNGSLEAAANDSYAIDLYDTGSKCTIQNGTFIGNIHAVYVFEGTLVVNGGTFSVQQKFNNDYPDEYVLNCYDESYRNGSATITVNGGSFVGFNPRNCRAEGVGTNFCAPGYVVTVESGEFKTYTVSRLKEGNMAVIPEQSGENNVSASLEGIYTTNTDSENIQGDAENALSGTVQNNNVSISLNTGGENITSAALKVAADTVGSLAQNNATLTIQSTVGTLKVDSTALNTLASSDTAVTLSIAKGQTTNSDIIYILTAVDQTGTELFAPSEEEQGAITITVPYTSTAPNVYYIGKTALEKMEVTDNEEDNTISWTVEHFSQYLATDDTYVASATTASGVVGYTTLTEAMQKVTADGTVTLLQNITNSNMGYTSGQTMLSIDKNVTIVGNEQSINITLPDAIGDEDQAIGVGPNATLTLDGVNLTIHGKENGHGDGIDVWSQSKIQITNGSTISLNDLRSAFTMQGGKTGAAVVVTNSKVTATDINGNFSNGGSFTFTNSDIDITNCTSYGISANQLTVDHSTVDISGTGYSAIKTVDENAAVKVVNDSTITVSNSGERLPFESNWGKATGVVDLGHGSGNGTSTAIANTSASLTVESGSVITLSNNKDAANFVYLTTTADLQNSGTITAVETETPTNNAYRVTYTVNGEFYWTDVVSASEGTVSYTEPADPVVSGYTFEGWDYGEVVITKTENQVSFAPTADQNTYTFTAVLRRNSSSGGPSVTSYSIQVSDMTNGQVTASKKIAQRGEEVTLTVTPAEGYELSTLTVTDRNGDTVTLNQQTGGTYTFVMPASNVTIRATFVETAPVEPTLPFIDVAERDWFYDAVAYVYENELMNGITATTFSPDATTTRGMIAAILWRQEEQPAAAGSTFTDVASQMYYAEAIAWAERNGIVNGVSETEFAPDRAIAREELAAILYRYAAYKGYDVTASADLSSFTDAGTISPYAVDAMQWAGAEEIIQGVTTTTLAPQGSAIRAQVATMLMRFLESHAA